MSETLDLSTGTATVAKIKRVIEELDEKKKETLKVTRLKVIVATTNCRRLFFFAVGGPSTTHSCCCYVGCGSSTSCPWHSENWQARPYEWSGSYPGRHWPARHDESDQWRHVRCSRSSRQLEARGGPIHNWRRGDRRCKMVVDCDELEYIQISRNALKI
jgi:hypothetical protein